MTHISFLRIFLFYLVVGGKNYLYRHYLLLFDEYTDESKAGQGVKGERMFDRTLPVFVPIVGRLKNKRRLGSDTQYSKSKSSEGSG